jgi:uncharacterized protein YecT (DUF1311 family)
MTRIWMVIVLIATVASAACGRERISAEYPTQDCNKATNQMDLNQCAEANFESADRKMNEMLRAAMDAQGDDGAKDRLRESQRAWVARRDKECADQVGPREEGGSIWPMDLASCLEQKTAGRIRELQKDL